MQVDVNQELLDKSTANIEKTILRGFKKPIEAGKMDEAAAKAKKDEIMSRIKGVVSPEEAAKDADLVIEAVPEKIELKQVMEEEEVTGSHRAGFVTKEPSQLC